MKHSKKFWSMTLSSLLALSMLAGCGANDTSDNGGGASSPGGEDGVGILLRYIVKFQDRFHIVSPVGLCPD